MVETEAGPLKAVAGAGRLGSADGESLDVAGVDAARAGMDIASAQTLVMAEAELGSLEAVASAGVGVNSIPDWEGADWEGVNAEEEVLTAATALWSTARSSGSATAMVLTARSSVRDCAFGGIMPNWSGNTGGWLRR